MQDVRWNNFIAKFFPKVIHLHFMRFVKMLVFFHCFSRELNLLNYGKRRSIVKYLDWRGSTLVGWLCKGQVQDLVMGMSWLWLDSDSSSLSAEMMVRRLLFEPLRSSGFSVIFTHKDFFWQVNARLRMYGRLIQLPNPTSGGSWSPKAMVLHHACELLKKNSI